MTCKGWKGHYGGPGWKRLQIRHNCVVIPLFDSRPAALGGAEWRHAFGCYWQSFETAKAGKGTELKGKDEPFG